MDYGNLLFWESNSVGKQVEPSLTQLFGLKVINSKHTHINMTSKVPTFQVAGLQSEKAFTVTVHSSNLRGQSEKVILSQ